MKLSSGPVVNRNEEPLRASIKSYRQVYDGRPGRKSLANHANEQRNDRGELARILAARRDESTRDEIISSQRKNVPWVFFSRWSMDVFEAVRDNPSESAYYNTVANGGPWIRLQMASIGTTTPLVPRWKNDLFHIGSSGFDDIWGFTSILRVAALLGFPFC